MSTEDWLDILGFDEEEQNQLTAEACEAELTLSTEGF